MGVGALLHKLTEIGVEFDTVVPILLLPTYTLFREARVTKKFANVFILSKRCHK